MFQSHALTFSLLVECFPSDVNCFLGLNVDDILWAQSYTINIPLHPSLALTEMPWEPTLDEKIIPDQPLNLFAKGEFYKVPIIFGTNQNETASFGFDLLRFLDHGFSMDPFLYEALVVFFFQENTEKILQLYPPQTNSLNTALRLTTDFLFVCPTRLLAKYAATFSTFPIRTYHFTWSSSTDPMFTNDPWCCENGTVCHAGELTYVFHSDFFYPGFQRSQKELDLSWTMLNFWTDFAHQQLNSTQWPIFTKDNQQTIEFTIPIQPNSNYDKTNCDFWDSIGYDW